MKLKLATALLALSLPHVAFAQTLCEKGETDHLSCPTNGGKKILSICSNIKDGAVDADSWLQYRFGKKGQIELAYPKEKKDSVSKFEGNYFNPREQATAIVDLRFMSGSALYSVTLNRIGIADEGGGSEFSGGIQVALRKNRRINIECDKIDGGRYFEDFRLLGNVVGQPDEEGDMLQRFYKNDKHETLNEKL